ncbi:hypothetical protein TNIN_241061 [Trichonephila inaurata madagascariensis]|uniref:Uncharacterized protein n=1 Tax=Trichonephila inaurata madagascariensis TaxID=2747483 RepID=A0A8X6YAH2_9ARAC|nr:hypothetical protein TNIN_241061 [Trichonephila inaurata madagascariensis]
MVLITCETNNWGFQSIVAGNSRLEVCRLIETELNERYIQKPQTTLHVSLVDNCRLIVQLLAALRYLEWNQWEKYLMLDGNFLLKSNYILVLLYFGYSVGHYLR